MGRQRLRLVQYVPLCHNEVANDRLANHPPLRDRWSPGTRLWILGVVHRHQSFSPLVDLEEQDSDWMFNLHVLPHVCYAWWNVCPSSPSLDYTDVQVPASSILPKWKEPFPRTIRY